MRGEKDVVTNILISIYRVEIDLSTQPYKAINVSESLNATWARSSRSDLVQDVNFLRQGGLWCCLLQNCAL